MIVSIASGKGGTGKTTVSASLVSVWDTPVVACDLDVEEPNLHLFLHPEWTEKESVGLDIPVVDASRCTLCRACVEICQFKAITIMGDTLLPFPEMCHGCGGCKAVCPEDAISWGNRVLGELAIGNTGAARFIMGRLRVGEAMSPPLMRVAKARLQDMLAEKNADAIIDAPPGVSCPAVASVIDSDCIVLVTEPTPFGFHDFALAWEAFAPLGKPMGAVINRAGLGDATVQRFCKEKSIPVLAEIPFDRTIAAGYSRGEVVASLTPELGAVFRQLRDAVRALPQQKEAAHV